MPSFKGFTDGDSAMTGLYFTYPENSSPSFIRFEPEADRDSSSSSTDSTGGSAIWDSSPSQDGASSGEDEDDDSLFGDKFVAANSSNMDLDYQPSLDNQTARDQEDNGWDGFDDDAFGEEFEASLLENNAGADNSSGNNSTSQNDEDDTMSIEDDDRFGEKEHDTGHSFEYMDISDAPEPAMVQAPAAALGSPESTRSHDRPHEHLQEGVNNQTVRSCRGDKGHIPADHFRFPQPVVATVASPPTSDAAPGIPENIRHDDRPQGDGDSMDGIVYDRNGSGHQHSFAQSVLGHVANTANGAPVGAVGGEDMISSTLIPGCPAKVQNQNLPRQIIRFEDVHLLVRYMSKTRKSTLKQLYDGIGLDKNSGIDDLRKKSIKEIETNFDSLLANRSPQRGQEDVVELLETAWKLLAGKAWGETWFGHRCSTAQTRSLFWPEDSSILLVAYARLSDKWIYIWKQTRNKSPQQQPQQLSNVVPDASQTAAALQTPVPPAAMPQQLQHSVPQLQHRSYSVPGTAQMATPAPAPVPEPAKTTTKRKLTIEEGDSDAKRLRQDEPQGGGVKVETNASLSMYIDLTDSPKVNNSSDVVVPNDANIVYDIHYFDSASSAVYFQQQIRHNAGHVFAIIKEETDVLTRTFGSRWVLTVGNKKAWDENSWNAAIGLIYSQCRHQIQGDMVLPVKVAV